MTRTLAALLAQARSFAAKPKPQPALQPSLDFNGQPITSGPRAYLDNNAYVPLTMAALAMIVHPTEVDLIRTRIQQRIDEHRNDLEEFERGLRARELDLYVSIHHPRIAAQFDRVATVKRKLKRK